MKPSNLDQQLYDLGLAPTAYWDTTNTNGTLLVDASYVEMELPHLIENKTMLPWFDTDLTAKLIPYWLDLRYAAQRNLKAAVFEKLKWAAENGHVDPIYFRKLQ